MFWIRQQRKRSKILHQHLGAAPPKAFSQEVALDSGVACSPLWPEWPSACTTAHCSVHCLHWVKAKIPHHHSSLHSPSLASHRFHLSCVLNNFVFLLYLFLILTLKATYVFFFYFVFSFMYLEGDAWTRCRRREPLPLTRREWVQCLWGRGFVTSACPASAAVFSQSGNTSFLLTCSSRLLDLHWRLWPLTAALC